MTANPPSFKSIWQRAIGESDLPSTTRHVLLATSVHFMDENGGHCFPSITDIMRVTGLTRKYVVRHLSLASDKGWLERWHFGRGRANRRRNYQAQLPKSDIAENRLDERIDEVDHQPPEIVSLGNHKPPEIVSLGNHQPPEIVSLGNHKPCRDLTMQRESNHARGRAREAEPTTSASATAPTLSVEKKTKFVKLTDALIERAKKTGRQRGVRNDLSDAAVSHSLEKFRSQKGYLEMTESAWIEAALQWIGKERIQNPPTARYEAVSSQEQVQVSPEEKARRSASYAAEVAAIDARAEQRRLALLDERGIDPSTGTKARVNPIDAVKALAAKVTAKPADTPPPRTFGPMGYIPGQRPPDAPTAQPLPDAPRAALNALVLSLHQAGQPLPNVAAICREIHDAGEHWPAVLQRYCRDLDHPQKQEAAA